MSNATTSQKRDYRAPNRSNGPASRKPGFASLAGAVLLIGLFSGGMVSTATAQVVYETESEFQSLRVVDRGGMRYLMFDGAQETRISLANPLQGHFEYIEYFHMPWLWNPNINSVLMVGLGGGSIQRHYQNYYPSVRIDTVEIDPKVVEVAKKFFGVEETASHRIHVADGRAFLEQSQRSYDLIIMDAYGGDAAGDAIPYRLATQEFFELALRRLTPNGILTYNVMGTLTGWRSDLLGALYRTTDSVFPQVYLFPAQTSRNVVMIATRDPRLYNIFVLEDRGYRLIERKYPAFSNFLPRLANYRVGAPPTAARSPILTDRLISSAERPLGTSSGNPSKLGSEENKSGNSGSSGNGSGNGDGNGNETGTGTSDSADSGNGAEQDASDNPKPAEKEQENDKAESEER